MLMAALQLQATKSGQRVKNLLRNHLAQRGPPTPQPLHGVADLVRLLHEQMEAVRADGAATPLERARVIGSLAGQARRAIEIGQLVARVEMLETVLKQRNGELPR
jgi:hypothetical protein